MSEHVVTVHVDLTVDEALLRDVNNRQDTIHLMEQAARQAMMEMLSEELSKAVTQRRLVGGLALQLEPPS